MSGGAKDKLGVAGPAAAAEVAGAPLKEEHKEGDEDGGEHRGEGEEDPGEVVIDDGSGQDVVHGHGDEQREEVKEGEGMGEAQARGPPVEGVEVKEFGDPEEADQVVETVVEDKEEPEVERDERFAVARPPASIAAAEMLFPVAGAGEGGVCGGEAVGKEDYGVSEDREVKDILGGCKEQRQDQGHRGGACGVVGGAAVGVGSAVRDGQDRGIVGGNGICRERDGTPGDDLEMMNPLAIAALVRKQRTHYRGRQDHQ